MLDDHRTAERRSIALHRLVAERLDEALLAETRLRLERATTAGGPGAHAWLELLELPLDELRERLVEDSEPMRALRQNTPFAGVVAPRERWRVIREVR